MPIKCQASILHSLSNQETAESHSWNRGFKSQVVLSPLSLQDRSVEPSLVMVLRPLWRNSRLFSETSSKFTCCLGLGSKTGLGGKKGGNDCWLKFGRSWVSRTSYNGLIYIISETEGRLMEILGWPESSFAIFWKKKLSGQPIAN